MVNLRLEHEVLILEKANDEEINSWEKNVYIQLILGFELDEKNNRYVYRNKKHFLKTLTETIQFLDDEKLFYSCDKNIQEIRDNAVKENKDFKVARKSGQEIKTSKKLIYPSGLVRQLKSYQVKGFNHLLEVKNGANFSVPGSGKTTMIYAAYHKLKTENIIEKILVIGPRSCFSPWEEEGKECFGKELRSVRLSGSKTDRKKIYLFYSSKYDLFLCTYQTAKNDKKEIIELCRKFNIFIIVDESHNVKQAGGVWSEAILEIAPYAKRRAILSGTPIPNNLLDLWTQITFLWPSEQVLGDRTSYQYLCEDEEAVSKIKKSIRPFIFRVPKSELGLPNPQFYRYECELSPYQAEIYRSLAIKYLNEINLPLEDRIQLRQWRKARMVRLIQAATNPTLLAKYSDEFDVPSLSGENETILSLIEHYPNYEMPSKFNGVLKIVKKLVEENKKVIIWTTFILNIHMFSKLLQNYRPYIIYGAVPKDENEDIEFNREQQIRDFKADTTPAILLANPAACAESISLHKVCHDAIYLDRTFNCGQYLQSLDRLHRIGLEASEIVNYHIFISTGTIDETIDRRLLEKEDIMLKILEDEIPIGTFEVEPQQLGQTEREEMIDFEETFKDIKKQFASDVV